MVVLVLVLVVVAVVGVVVVVVIVVVVVVVVVVVEVVVVESTTSRQLTWRTIRLRSKRRSTSCGGRTICAMLLLAGCTLRSMSCRQRIEPTS